MKYKFSKGDTVICYDNPFRVKNSDNSGKGAGFETGKVFRLLNDIDTDNPKDVAWPEELMGKGVYVDCILKKEGPILLNEGVPIGNNIQLKTEKEGNMLIQVGIVGIQKQTGTTPEKRTVLTAPEYLDAKDSIEAIVLHSIKYAATISKAKFDQLEVFVK